jgi:hypothetical protein
MAGVPARLSVIGLPHPGQVFYLRLSLLCLPDPAHCQPRNRFTDKPALLTNLTTLSPAAISFDGLTIVSNPFF